MKQTTNKKTNEVFEVVAVLENGVQLLNIDTKEEKTVAHSTFKRWYTKPVEVEVVAEEEKVEFPELEEEEVFEEETVEEQVETETVTEEEKEEVEEIQEIKENATVEELKDYLIECLSIVNVTDEANEFVECKDNILAVRYFGKTVAQIKGKRKVRIYLNGRHMEPETFEKCEHDRPEYTHNAFIKLEDKESLQLALTAIEEVRTWVRLNKQGK